MGKNIRDSRGFTLIAALLLTLLLSALALGLFYLVNNEQHMGSNDLEGNLAYYGAESGMENLTAQLSALYQTSTSPNVAAIQALTAPTNWPTNITGSNITNITYTMPPILFPTTEVNGNPCLNPIPPPAGTNPCSTWDIVGAGQDQGMVASLIPFTLQVTATRLAGAGEATNNAGALSNITGAAVNLTRTVQVALLPAFEFGIFCAYDCDYFAGPNYNFGGRVHSNGNLFLASGSTLTFTDKIAAVNQVVTTQLENGWPTSTDYTGNVYIPNAPAGCPNAPTAGPGSTPAECLALSAGSWAGGFPPPPAPATCTADCGGAANAGWKGISTTTYNDYIINGLTGATPLQLPFVQADSVGSIEIIRRPQASDSPLLSNARLYSEANIRILLADTIKDLHPERGAGALDADDVQIGVSAVTGGNYQSSELTGFAGAAAGDYMYFGRAYSAGNAVGWVPPMYPSTTTEDYDWKSWPLMSQITSNPPPTYTNADVPTVPLVAGTTPPNVWLRVEYLNAAGAWVGVTRQWLAYGFGRGYNMPPSAPYGGTPCPTYPTFPPAATPQCSNPISPAILILQQLQYGVTPGVGNSYEASGTDAYTPYTNTAYKWIPINFYDSREGEPHDDSQTARSSNTPGAASQTVYTPCSPIGVMNAVELDVGNLWLWLQGVAPYNASSGPLVNTASNLQNGYILYFSDRRGMMPDNNPPAALLYNNIPGNSGLEDTVNAASNTGKPDGALEPATYYSYSPEDVDGDGYFDIQGETYLAAGFGLTSTNYPYAGAPYYPIPAQTATVGTNQLNCSVATENAADNAYGTFPYGFSTAAERALVTPPPAYAESNIVTGPRHVLRLVDGGMNPANATSYLPHPAAGLTGDGFTVASEEPVYVLGDYNTGSTDPFWPSENTTTTPHSAASIIADAVTLLSDPPTGATPAAGTAPAGWTDAQSFLQPGNVGNRQATESYYRVAIAAGKSIPFPQPAWAAAIPVKDFGTDGGMHNFLRYLESMTTVNYAGSMISMYYSQYATGDFKCCTRVYGAPTRNYFFDTQFLNPANLPPGTPMFQDVVSLGFHQNFTPQ